MKGPANWAVDARSVRFLFEQRGEARAVTVPLATLVPMVGLEAELLSFEII